MPLLNRKFWNANTHYHGVVLASLPPNASRVLDAGCGDGILAGQLVEAGVEQVVGIDVDRAVLDRARQRNDGTRIEWICGDVVSTPLDAGSFDAVVSVAALHQMDAGNALSCFARLVRPGGVVVVVGLAACEWWDLPLEAVAMVLRVVLGAVFGHWHHSAPQCWPPPLKYREMKALSADLLPGVRYRRHLLGRFSLVWHRPSDAVESFAKSNRPRSHAQTNTGPGGAGKSVHRQERSLRRGAVQPATRATIGGRRRMSLWLRPLALMVSLWAASPLPGLAQAAPRWLDTFESRLEILALTQTLNAEILASSSATLSLENWCRDHKMADPPMIVARVIAGANDITAEQIQRLQVTAASDVKYRRVELRCGSHVLSKAELWYVPSRLTTDMNTLLDNGETPFGKAVLPLRPYRRTFAATTLWSPLPPGWEQQPRATGVAGERRPLILPDALFEHRAILYTSDHHPIAEVSERYQGQLLAFAPAR